LREFDTPPRGHVVSRLDFLDAGGCVRSRFLRRLLRASLWIAGVAGLLLAAALAYLLGPALYHRYSLFPRQHAAIRQLAAQHRPVSLPPGWKELLAACHVHTDLSHDSDGHVEEIRDAARLVGVDVVLLADHPREGKADFSLQPAGLGGGVRFVSGFEMRHGFMPWGLRKGAVLDSREAPADLARRIHELGGILFFAHIEQDRDWELPELSGLEVYNIHADFKGMSLHRIIAELVVSSAAYPDEVLRLVFDRPTENLQKWDRLSAARPLAGIAGNDAHRNAGLQGFYTDRDTLQISTTAPDDVVAEWKLNAVTRSLLRLTYGPLRIDRPLFKYEADRYETMMRFVGTHLWVREDSEEAILDAVRRGRALIAFNHLSSARGFQFWAETGSEAEPARAMMGEAMPWQPGATLHVRSPMPCRFSLVRDGAVISRHEGYDWSVSAEGPGKYRLEAELRFLGEWVPWVYTNPVMLAEAK
jgi:hypothetical protein